MSQPSLFVAPLASGLMVLVISLGACSGSLGTETAFDGQPADPVDQADPQKPDDLMVKKEDGGDPQKDCERQLRLDAVKVSAPEPFDVIVVADHSSSLSWSRTDLATGLENFLAQVRGYEVRFFVLTPTQYGPTSEDSSTLGGYDRVIWKDPVTLEPYQYAMTRYDEVCVDESGQSVECADHWDDVVMSFQETGTWTFEMPEPVAALTPGMTDTAFAAEQAAVSSAILGLGLGGASDEQPVCTLSRYIRQAPNALPNNAVFLLLSDEDDASDPARCVKELANNVTLTGERPLFEIRGSELHSQRRFNCTPVDDQGNVAGSPVPHLWNLGSCTTPRDCTASDLQAALDQCPIQHIVQDCTITCQESEVLACRIDDTDAISDACNSSFQYNGVSYQNLQAYCEQTHPEIQGWGTCKEYVKDSTPSESAQLIPLVPVTTIAEMIQDFRSQADLVLGAESYSVELISFQPSFSCVPQAGQSNALTLASLVDGPDHLFPICDDYSAALHQVTKFAGELIQTAYPLTLADGEEPETVRVTGADGLVRELGATSFMYDATAQVLTVTDSSLLPTDLGLEVSVREACVVK